MSEKLSRPYQNQDTVDEGNECAAVLRKNTSSGLEDAVAYEKDEGQADPAPTTIAFPEPGLGDLPDFPPDGGKDAWLNVLGCWALLFASFGFITSFGQLEAYYLEHQLSGYRKPDVAWIGSSQLFFTYVFSLPFGRWFDSHGMRAPTIVGATLMTTSLIAVAFSYRFEHFILAHLAYGLGCGAVFAPSIAIPGQWFLHRRSTALAVIVSGTGVGGLVYPIMFVQLVQRTSFRNTLLVMAALNFVILVPTIFVVKARLPPRRGGPPLRSGILHALRQKAYVWLIAGGALSMVNIFTPFLNAPLLAQTHNLPSNIASYSVAILQTGSITGRLIAGPVADAFGVFPTFASAGLGMAVVLSIFWTTAVTGIPGTIIGLWGFGHTNGMWMALIGSCCAEITEQGGRMAELGMRTGLMFTVNAIPMLIGPVISGAIVNVTPDGTFRYAAVFNALTLLIGTGIASVPWFVRRFGWRRSGSWRSPGGL